MKTVIVTGASRGIGREIAFEAAQAGYNVVVNYLNSKADADSLVGQLTKISGVIAVRADVSKDADAKMLVDTAMSRFGAVNALVNNAGVAYSGLFQQMSDADITRILDVNLKGAMNVSKYALNYMLQKQSGKIVNITSMWGQVGASCEVAYSAAKAGLIGFTKALAKEVAPSDISVNAVSCGVINTDMLSCYTDADKAELISDTPLCRLGTPKDVASAVMFLLSENASFITGQTLAVNGGFVI